MILFAVIGAVKVMYFTTPVYEASGKMICARSEEAVLEESKVSTTDLSMSSSLSETYAELIRSDLVVNKVIENLKLNMTTAQLGSSISMTPVTTVYYQVSVRNENNYQAAAIVNEIMKVFSEEVKNFYALDNIYVVDNAQIPGYAVNMNIVKSVMIFAAIGLLVAGGTIVLLYTLNNTVMNAEQIQKYVKLPNLASIPKSNEQNDLITLMDSKSPYAESVKILRTNLQYMYNGGDLKTVAITSSLPEEGKSWLTANLAVAFANSGKKTLVIDADMRRGRQYRLFHLKKEPGLSEFLSDDAVTKKVVTVKARKVSKSGLARLLSAINKYIKIEKIPGLAKIIYQDDYFEAETDDSQVRMQSLKKVVAEDVAEVVVEPKTTKKTTTRKRTTKKDAAEDVQEPEKTTKRKYTKKSETKVEDAEKKTEVEKKRATRKTTKKVAEAKENVEQVENQVVKKPEKKKITDFIHETGIDNLYVLSAGQERMESSELLSNNKLKKALDELKEEYDMILIDTPPVSVVADGFIISRIVDTNIIVLKHGNTEINELNKIKNNIQEIGGNVIGTVINQIPDVNKKYYHTYYNKKA